MAPQTLLGLRRISVVEIQANGFFALEKISKDGNVKEFVWRYNNFPSEDDLNSKNLDVHYRIFYRQ